MFSLSKSRPSKSSELMNTAKTTQDVEEPLDDIPSPSQIPGNRKKRFNFEVEDLSSDNFKGNANDAQKNANMSSPSRTVDTVTFISRNHEDSRDTGKLMSNFAQMQQDMQSIVRETTYRDLQDGTFDRDKSRDDQGAGLMSKFVQIQQNFSGMSDKVKLGVLQKEYEIKCADLQRTIAALEQTRADLEQKSLQLAASDAMLVEHEHMGSNLMTSCTDLQNELKSHRSDRLKLLSKLDKLALSDVERSAQTDKFANDTVTATVALGKSINDTLASNESQACKICENVKGILSRGHDTCTLLTKCIDQAVKMLMDKPKANAVVSSCAEDTKTRLALTSTEVVKSLQVMQHQLVSWLGDVNSAILATRAMREQQQSKINATQQAVEKGSTSIADVSSEFMHQQAFLISQSESAVEALHALTSTNLQTQQKLIEESALKIKQDTALKVQYMQTAIGSILQHIVNSSQQSVDAFTQMALRTCQDTHAAYEGKIVEVMNSNSAAFSYAHSSITSISTQSISACNAAAQVFASIKQDHERSDKQLLEVLAIAEEKKAALNGTISSVVEYTEHALEQAVQSVSKMSVYVNAVLSGIAQDMQEASARTMRDYTAFTDKHCHKEFLKIEEYFQSLSQLLQTWSAALEQIESDAAAFRKVLQHTAVQPSGNTSTKKVLPSSQPLPLSASSSQKSERISEPWGPAAWPVVSPDNAERTFYLQRQSKAHDLPNSSNLAHDSRLAELGRVSISWSLDVSGMRQRLKMYSYAMCLPSLAIGSITGERLVSPPHTMIVPGVGENCFTLELGEHPKFPEYLGIYAHSQGPYPLSLEGTVLTFLGKSFRFEKTDLCTRPTYACFRVLISFKDANRVISSDAIVINCDLRAQFHDVPHAPA